MTRRVLLVDGQAVALHARAFDILEYLVACRERVVSRDEIVGHVWRGVVVGENNLSVQMSTLRRVLAAHGGAELIITVPHRGYQFVDDAPPAVSAGGAGLAEPPGAQGAKAVVAQAAALVAHRWPVLGAMAMAALLAAATVAWKTVWPARLSLEGVSGQAFNPPPHSVAVLAFSNMSGDPKQEYLSDGLSEELIASLSQVGAIQVTARTSAFFFKGRSATILDIAKILNVSAILEGSLRRQGDHLRIEARLTDAHTGFKLWSRSFDTELQDMRRMETSIADAVTNALQVTLAGNQASSLVRGASTNGDAIDAFLHGLEENRHPALQSYRAALANFNAAISLDPGYAFAYVGKALALTFIAGIGDASDLPSPLYQDALAAADRAVELAPDHGSTHIARATVLANGYLNFRDAWSEAREAEQLTPSDAPINLLFGVIAVYVGHTGEALSAARRAVALDPLHEDAWLELGWILRITRDFDGAFSAYQHAAAVGTPDLPDLQLERASAFVAMGHPERAQALCEGGSDWELLECRAIVDHAVGRHGAAVKAFDRLHQTMGDSLAYVYAVINAQWGRPDQAIRWLVKAKELKDSGLTLIKTDPLLDPIRGEPGFAALVNSLDFPE